MLQSTSLPPMLQVDELVAQASACYPDPMPLQEVLQRAGLQALAGRRYGQLSGGQQRAVQFAIALCGRPRVLFWTSPPPARISGRGRRCGRRSGSWWPKAAACC